MVLAAALLAAAVSVADGVQAANPIVAEGRFLSDPSGRVGPDGRLYVFGSRDESPKYYCSRLNDVLETEDLRSWRVHPGVFDAARIPGEDTVLFAPDAIFHRGRWWLFYCTPSAHAEGVASAETACGRYDGARRYGFADQIDPSVFRDDDGRIYYTWGQFSMKMAELKDDLSGIVPGTLHDGVIDESRHNFHEGSQLFKRNGVYYLAFADISRSHCEDGEPPPGKGMMKCRGRRPTCIGYATASSPFGPYVYRGVIVDNAGCDPESWNNHGSVVEFGGRWYVFYHRTTNASVSMRKACVEPIEFDADGLIREVEMTSNGVGAPLDPFVRTEARLACLMSGHARIVTLADGQERLGEIRGGDTATWRYFAFPRPASALVLESYPESGGRVVVSDARGTVIGEGTVPAGDGRALVRTEIPVRGSMPRGRLAVKLSFAAGDGAFGALDGFTFR